MFGFPLFAFKTFQQGSEVFDFAAERKHSHLFFAKSSLQLFKLSKNFAKLALHRERSFGALFAAGDGYVVKAFPGLREKKCIRIFECEPTRGIGAGNNVAVT